MKLKFEWNFFCVMQRVRSSADVSRLACTRYPTAVLDWKDASVDKHHCTQFLSDFDLPLDLDLPCRVYVLRCVQARTLTGGFAYYVGSIDKEYLQDRLQKHCSGHADGARFTKENKPLGLELLWPARSRAAEAYLFNVLLGKLGEDAVLRHGRLGGWTQTHVAPFPVANFNWLQREWRMVNDRCLDCGALGHFSGSILCTKIPGGAREGGGEGQKAIAKASNSPIDCASAPSLPIDASARLSTPVVEREAAVANVVAGTGKAKAAAPDDLDERFEKWLTRKKLHVDDNNWIPLKSVLLALNEPWKNPSRYVDPSSDAPSKLWTMGPQKRRPRKTMDYRFANNPHGGHKQLVVKKAFLKTVVAERYKRKL